MIEPAIEGSIDGGSITQQLQGCITSGGRSYVSRSTLVVHTHSWGCGVGGRYAGPENHNSCLHPRDVVVSQLVSQTDRQTDRQTHTHTHIHTHIQHQRFQRYLVKLTTQQESRVSLRSTQPQRGSSSGFARSFSKFGIRPGGFHLPNPTLAFRLYSWLGVSIPHCITN